MVLFSWVCAFLALSGSIVSGTIKDKGWWKNALFYQVYPRSFMDSDDDGIGDLKGITRRLEHFLDAGVDAIWLSPIYSSPMKDFGYDISDYRNIHKPYGTLTNLEDLTNKAKRIGLKVIMDFVPNHTSDEHYWFQRSLNGDDKYKDYYVWQKGRANNTQVPNNWISQFTGPAWTYKKSRDLWYYHGFGSFQPELNFTNPDVRREMIEILRFWLGKGIDGFRIDAIPYIYETDGLPDEPRSNVSGVSSNNWKYLEHIYTQDDPRTYNLVDSWRKVVDDWADQNNDIEKVILTEAYTSLANTTKYYKYGSQVPMNFDLIMKVNKDSKPSDFKKIIDDWMRSMPHGAEPNWVLGNHDRSRAASRFAGRADQLLMLSMILPGISVTYNGEEIAMTDKDDITWEETVDPQACNTDPETYRSTTRDPERTPFQWDDTKNSGFSNATKTWLPVNDNYKQLNLAKQKQASRSHYKLYQSLVKLRKASKTLKAGNLKVKAIKDDNVLVIIRHISDEAVILLLNFSKDHSQQIDIQTDPKNAEATIILSDVGSNIEWGSTVTGLSNVSLPSTASLVLKIKAQKIENVT